MQSPQQNHGPKTMGQKFLDWSFAKAVHQLPHMHFAPPIRLPDARTESSHLIARIAEILDWTEEVSSERVKALREFLTELKPHLDDGAGSVKCYEKRLLEKSADRPYDQLHILSVCHLLCSHAQITHALLALRAIRFREPILIQRSSLSELPHQTDGNVYPEIEGFNFFLKTGDAIHFDAELLKSHLLDISSPADIAIGSLAEAERSMAIGEISCTIEGTPPYIWRSDSSHPIPAQSLGKEGWTFTDDSSVKTNSPTGVVVQLDTTDAQAGRISIINQGTSELYLGLVNPATIPFPR